MTDTWKKLLEEEKGKEYFKKLEEFLDKEYEENEIYPERKNLYNALDLTSYEDTNVIILGQDPYHGSYQAHGLSFSIESEKAKFPPSLRNMFKELKTDLDIERTERNLTDWAEQGVLLLNTVLTVQAGKAASHRKKGWETFTDTIIKKLNDKDEQVIFVLWGGDAKKKVPLITNPKHKIIEGVHPSPLSAHTGFFGSKPFSRINEYLEEAGKSQINW
jgi:uracil-DNA glycosylase